MKIGSCRRINQKNLTRVLTARLKTRFMSGTPTNGLRKKENITKGVCRENTQTESVRSQKIQSSPIMEISRQRMPHFRSGITDTENQSGQFYGQDKMIRCVEAQTVKTPAFIIQALLEDIHSHIGQGNQSDDLTLLAIKYKGIPGSK